jgi:hypothetical protein
MIKTTVTTDKTLVDANDNLWCISALLLYQVHVSTPWHHASRSHQSRKAAVLPLTPPANVPPLNGFTGTTTRGAKEVDQLDSALSAHTAHVGMIRSLPKHRWIVDCLGMGAST